MTIDKDIHTNTLGKEKSDRFAPTVLFCFISNRYGWTNILVLCNKTRKHYEYLVRERIVCWSVHVCKIVKCCYYRGVGAGVFVLV